MLRSMARALDMLSDVTEEQPCEQTKAAEGEIERGTQKRKLFTCSLCFPLLSTFVLKPR